jgi:alkylation response protein AidB-like acyl-CoA dehydrogenase
VGSGIDGRELVRAKVEQLLSSADLSDPPAFWAAQFDAGLAWVHFPVGLGGLGVEAQLQGSVIEALNAAGAPNNRIRNKIALRFVAPTLLAHGTDEQRRRFLKPMFTCEHLWCQLFSEPGAGSDLAGLATHARRDGNDWLVTGQKVWTSRAQYTQRALLLTRTNPDVPKHAGMTYFLLDMASPGIDVRPLRQLTGESEFNEVHLDDVRVPDRDRIGGVNDGWSVALTTLTNERQSWAPTASERGAGPIGEAVRAWRERQHDDPARRDELIRLWVRAEANRLTGMRSAVSMADGRPGPEGSVAKIVGAELNKKITSLTVNLLGADGLLYSGYERHGAADDASDANPFGGADAGHSFLRALANSIEAGTTEINKNIVAERVLGLPGDIKVDRHRPWRQLKRG